MINLPFSFLPKVIIHKWGCRILILVVAISYLSCEAKAQGVRLYNSGDGLPSSKFTSMNLDKDGYLWICNYGGLSRFDGFGLTTFYESRGVNKLRSNTVYHFHTDRLGQCWVGTTRGLQLFHPKTEQFEHIRLDSSEDNNTTRKGKSMIISDIITVPNSNKILVTAGGDGFYIIDIISHKVIETETSKIRRAFKNIAPGRIFFDSRQRLWVAAGKVLLFDMKTYRHLSFTIDERSGIKPDNMEITDFLEDRKTHTVFIADNWNGLLAFDEQRKVLQEFTQSPTPYKNAQCLLQRKDGAILVGCEKNGIGQIDLSTKTINEYNIKDVPFELAQSKIHAMHEDKWGNLYIGIYQKGLLVVPAQTGGFKFQNISESDHAPSQAAVTSFVGSSDGAVLVGTDGDGVFYGRNFDKMSKLKLPAQCNGSIQHMVAAKDGRIWLATYGSGLYCYDHGAVNTVPNTLGVINKNVSYLGLDKQQKKLYIANVGSGLNLLDLATGKFSKTHFGSSWIFSLNLDSKNRLWIGEGGCICYNLANNKKLDFRLDSISNSRVHTFLEYNGTMYIGTNNGLFIFDAKTNSSKQYPLDENNKAVSVMSIIKSKNNLIWMATNRGLVRFNPKNEDIRIFSSYEIRKVGDFHSNAVYEQNDGSIIFGGDNGVVSFNPATIENRNTEIESIHFSSLYVNGKVVSYDINSKQNILNAAIGYVTRIDLPHNQNSFSIGFSTFNYAVSSQLRYQYRLKGFETVWHTTSPDNPQAVYNQIPSGEYTLEVRSFNDEKGGKIAEATVDIIISSPWYWSWWTKLLYCIIILTIAYIQYREYQIRELSKKRLRGLMSEFLSIKETYQNMINNQANESVPDGKPVDDKLKKRIMEVISEHVSDAHFGVEELSREIALSRVHLYRRTKELFGCSPNDLLKSVRMKKAGLMLVQGKGSISDIAYEVGFSEPSYFSRSFKSYYNMSPKDFIARYRDNADDETVKKLFEL